MGAVVLLGKANFFLLFVRCVYGDVDKEVGLFSFLDAVLICLCWGFTAQSTQWGHVERGQFT